MLSVRQALRLIRDGMAKFILRNTAIQLTFCRLVNLRDQSCKADEQFIFQYLCGSTDALVALSEGWALPPAIIARSCPQWIMYPFV